MRTKRSFAAALCFIFFLSHYGRAEFEFLKIGNPGNPADVHITQQGPVEFGSVGYDYAISRYAVSNADWADFRPDHVSPFTGDNKPVQNITWNDAAQYCNWLTSDDPFTGAYLFTGGNFSGVDRAAAIAKLLNGQWEKVYVLPTEDEWHKAAYYNQQDGTYSSYANGTNTPPVAGVDAMYGQTESPYAGPWDVGHGTREQNGTYNMMGNVWEWTEDDGGGLFRALRGGAFDTTDPSRLSSSDWHYGSVPHGAYDNAGFRVVTVMIPEPASLILLAAGAVALRRTRRFA